MKNWKTRIIVFAFLAIASLSAYSYLNTVPQSEINNLYGVEQVEEKEVNLPDVEMVNKIIEAGKKLSTLRHL